MNKFHSNEHHKKTNALGIKSPTLTKLEQPILQLPVTHLVLVNSTIKGIDFFNFLHIHSCYLFALHSLTHQNSTYFDMFTIRGCNDKYSNSTFFCFSNHNANNQTLIGYNNCFFKINNKLSRKKNRENILPNQLMLDFDNDIEEQPIDAYTDYEEAQWKNFLQKMQSKSTHLQQIDFVFHFSYNNYFCLKSFFLFFLSQNHFKYQLLPIEHLDKKSISEFSLQFQNLEKDILNSLHQKKSIYHL